MIDHKNIFAATFICMGLIGCGGGIEDKAESIFVYDDRMPRGCNFAGNITLEESVESLVSLGVGPISSSCAKLTNIVFTESCDSRTGDLYVHEIFSENIVDLELSNFKDTANLDNHLFPDGHIVDSEEISYKITECPQGETSESFLWNENSQKIVIIQDNGNVPPGSNRYVTLDYSRDSLTVEAQELLSEIGLVSDGLSCIIDGTSYKVTVTDDSGLDTVHYSNTSACNNFGDTKFLSEADIELLILVLAE